ncbi:MAG: hypothetical protein NC417_08415 [Candidatus Gastranaerophilales bacterium]|nr:hypothetical protein [Candidatus Gastranaerophilales bacterium]
MFGFGRKKKEKDVYIHPEFGEMKYRVNWEPPFKLKVDLWGKTYEFPIEFFADSPDEKITPAQEEAFEKVKQFMTEQRDLMENMARPVYGVKSEMALSDRVLPDLIQISRKGEAAILFRDIEEEKDLVGPDYKAEDYEDEAVCDDYEVGFAIIVHPLLTVIPAEECWQWFHGFEDIDSIIDYIKKYGDGVYETD